MAAAAPIIRKFVYRTIRPNTGRRRAFFIRAIGKSGSMPAFGHHRKGRLKMGNMTPITVSVDGVSHTFTLLEADISALTFHNEHETEAASNGSDFTAFMALAAAIGINRAGERREVDAFFTPGVFYQLVDPKGADY